MAKQFRFVYWSPARLALWQECRQHPVLVESLAQYGVPTEDNFGEYLAEICTYLHILADDIVLETQEEKDNLCNMLRSKLQEMRKIVIH